MLQRSYISRGAREVPVTSMSSREFNQDTARAKKAAKKGSVFITDRGRPAHAPLTVNDCQNLTSAQSRIVEPLAMPGAADILAHRR